MPQGVDHSAFTWDPVSATWVHERGPEISPPPPPPDVHSIQTYFFEPDSKQWIRTVLADRGRQLAAQWQGAHRIPTDPVPATKEKGGKTAKKKSSPMPVIAAIVVLLLIVGGAAVFASQSGLLAGTVSPAATTPAASAASVAPSGAAPASESPSPSATAATGGGSGGGTSGGAPPPRTAPPATLSLPPGLSTRLPNGTAVIYTGPTLVVKPQALAATLQLTQANGQPAPAGPITIALSTVTANGNIDGNGRVTVTLATTTLTPGAYSLQVILQGTLATVTQITVR